MELLNVSHCLLCSVSHYLLYCSWLSLNVSLVSWSCCMSLTVSYGCWLSFTVSSMALGFLSLSTIWWLEFSHCLLYGCWLWSHGVSACLHCLLLLLAVSHYLLYVCWLSLTVSPVPWSCWLSLTVSYIVAGCLSQSLPVPWSCCMSLTVSYITCIVCVSLSLRSS